MPALPLVRCQHQPQGGGREQPGAGGLHKAEADEHPDARGGGARRGRGGEHRAAARLRDLVAAGLLERRPYREPGQRSRLEYHLTEEGADFFPALAALMQWGERWLGPSGVEMRHHGCGGPVRAELRCAEGHPVTVGDIDLAPRS